MKIELDEQPTPKHILERCWAIAAELNAAADRSPVIKVEHAAQVAELAGAARLHDPREKSADFLDGYVEGFERAAALIRQIGEIANG